MIENVPNKMKSNLIHLQKSNLPLLLYGAGAVAAMVKELLDRNNINIDKIMNFILDNILVFLMILFFLRYQNNSVLNINSKSNENISLRRKPYRK